MKKAKILLILLMIVVVFNGAFCKKTDADGDAYTEVNYELSNSIFPNPERGFMHLYPVSAEGEGLSLTLLKSLKNDHVTLIHRMYYFEKFKDKALSEVLLSLMQ